MADPATPASRGRPVGRASVRARTTLAAVLVVAVALLLGAVTLVALVRGSLRDGLESTAEQRAESLVAEIERSGLPAEPPEPSGGDGQDAWDDDRDEWDDGDLEELVWQVTAVDGSVLRSSQPLASPLPTVESEDVRLPGADHDYLVVTERADAGDASSDDAGSRDPETKTALSVTVAVSLEDVEESTAALVLPLAVGLPLLLLVVAGTTWAVASRALAPVERIRREVEQITGESLERRVPEPTSRDEIHRLARTMNQMLHRLEESRSRQQQFVGDASHELRSPLASIRQAAEVSRTHPGALPEGELAETVLEESIRMQRLVEQLLLLTRADEGVLVQAERDVDLDDVALTVAGRAGRADVRLDLTGVTPARVRGDATALDRVVQNLVDNALRHADEVVALTVRESGGAAELVVEDDGPGIGEADRERVFDRFVRLDEARASDDGGSGLGLAIVQQIVTAHGGTVAVSSSPLGGARFVVRLPAPARAPYADAAR